MGFNQGRKQSDTIVIEGVSDLNQNGSETASFGTFWEVWKIIDERLFAGSKGVGDQEKIYGAARGLVRSLGDPYSDFFSPEENKQFQEDVQGNFSGIGAEIGIRKDQLQIIAPLKDSPAEKAGLRPGDKIFFINSSSTEGITTDEAVRQIRGKEGTDVVLTILREGADKTEDIKVRRAPISVPTLGLKMLDNGIAHISLYHFNANATELFGKTVAEAIGNGMNGMVLDLRNNPGGYLDVAVDLAGWFVPRGEVVVKERTREAPDINLKSTGNASLKNLPLVVLINRGSASASEILAGSLRDNNSTPLIGEQSYGKGTVQEIFTLKGNSSVKLTVANWVLPNGLVLEGAGLAPDIEVLNTEEDIAADKDVQLEKALEVLRSKIKQ